MFFFHFQGSIKKRNKLLVIYVLHHDKTSLRGFRPNRTVQQQMMARGLKFRIYNVEKLDCLCSENKGADMRLCFRICKFSNDAAHIWSRRLHVQKVMPL